MFVLWLKARDLSVNIPCSSVMGLLDAPLREWAAATPAESINTGFSSSPVEVMLHDGMSDGGQGTWAFTAYKSKLEGAAGGTQLNKVMACFGPAEDFTRAAANTCCTRKWTEGQAAEGLPQKHLAIQTKLYTAHVPPEMFKVDSEDQDLGESVLHRGGLLVRYAQARKWNACSKVSGSLRDAWSVCHVREHAVWLCGRAAASLEEAWDAC